MNHAIRHYTVKLEVTIHECDKTGRHYVRFTPVIKPDVCATGELRTATYDAWVDEPGDFARQKAAALANAETTLTHLFGDAIPDSPKVRPRTAPAPLRPE